MEGFEREDDVFVCDNGKDGPGAGRGASQTVVLNQTRPEPIVAVAWSKAEGVTGSPDTDYSLYLDLVYADGTPLWGQIAPFATGTHDWQRRQVVVLPEKPVRLAGLPPAAPQPRRQGVVPRAELRVVRAAAGRVPVRRRARWCRAAAAARRAFRSATWPPARDFVRLERAGARA